MVTPVITNAKKINLVKLQKETDFFFVAKAECIVKNVVKINEEVV